jgi:hypothetical protein
MSARMDSSGQTASRRARQAARLTSTRGRRLVRPDERVAGRRHGRVLELRFCLRSNSPSRAVCRSTVASSCAIVCRWASIVAICRPTSAANSSYDGRDPVASAPEDHLTPRQWSRQHDLELLNAYSSGCATVEMICRTLRRSTPCFSARKRWDSGRPEPLRLADVVGADRLFGELLHFGTRRHRMHGPGVVRAQSRAALSLTPPRWGLVV